MTELPGATYATLDDPDVRALALDDPAAFVEGRPGLFAVDEVQRAPDLMPAVKAAVDRDQRPGRFLLTGSSRLSADPGVSETLAGCVERHTLWPLSRAELERRRASFLDRLFGADPVAAPDSPLTERDDLERALAGGFPAAASRRGARFTASVETVIEREAPGISASPRTADLPRLLRWVASRHAGVLNVSDLAADPSCRGAAFCDISMCWRPCS